MTADKLRLCPDSPNCVSSQSSDPRHAIAPIPYEGTAEKARELLIKVVLGMKRSRIVISEMLYLHAEFTSAFFRFVEKSFHVPDALLARMEQRRPRSRAYVERGQRGGLPVGRWNLILLKVLRRGSLMNVSLELNIRE